MPKPRKRRKPRIIVKWRTRRYVTRKSKPRLESNEEILQLALQQFGTIRLRLHFQVCTRDGKTHKWNYRGLKGAGINLAVRSPGMAIAVVRRIEEFLEKWASSPVALTPPPSSPTGVQAPSSA